MVTPSPYLGTVEHEAAAEDGDIRFCTSCGTALVDRQCPACRTDAADDADASEPDPGMRRRLLAPVVLAVVGVLAVGLVANLHRDAQDLDRTDRASSARAVRLTRRLDASETRLDDATKRLRALSDRVAALEAAALDSPSTAATAARAQESVFTVEAVDKLGTGWVVASDARTSTLVTNQHVVDPLGIGDQVDIVRDDLTFGARITFVDEEHDLALVITDHPFPSLGVERSEPAPGTAVIIVGSPLGLGGSVSTGVVSAIRDERGTELIQFTAPISPGNSGGPVLDEDGAVVGIAVEKVVDEAAEGIGFAIPVDELCRLTPAC